jgi:signal transduction histidine kinase
MAHQSAPIQRPEALPEGPTEQLICGPAQSFEVLIAEMMGALLSVPTELLNAEIERQLGRALRNFKLDRGSVTEVVPETGVMRITHAWARGGLVPPPKGSEAVLAVPWLVSRVLNGETTVLSSLEEMPPEAAGDRQFAQRQNIKSHLAIPLRIAGVVFGSLHCSTVTRKRRWNANAVRRLTLVAEIIGTAIGRRWTIMEIQRLTEESRGTARAMLMGEMTASLAHELNQPLGAILNNAQAATRLLSSSEPDLAETKEALHDIIRDNSRAVDIIRNVRAFLQRTEADKSPLNIRELLIEVEKILRHEAAVKRIALHVQAAQGLPDIRGNQTQMLQVLINLITNAFDAVTENAIGLRHVAVTASPDEGRVRVSVSDSGKGIDPEIMPRLFNPFVTSKAKGMGMGLAIARAIVEDHGGQIQAGQNPARGATLEFTLPAFGSIQGTIIPAA